MGGFGVMQYAKQAMEGNRNLLKRKSRFEQRPIISRAGKKTNYKYKKARPELLIAIRKRIREENKNQRRIRLVIATITTVISLVGIWLLLTL